MIQLVRDEPEEKEPGCADANKRRKFKNEDLIHRMREGESLALIPSQATFFQPRPIIKKDLKALQALGFINDKPGSDE